MKDKVIVFLGNTRYGGIIQSTSLFIARNLAKKNKVFFVDYPITLKDYATGNSSADFKERKQKYSLLSDGIIATDLPNLHIIVTPPILPINFLPEGPLFRLALSFNEGIISRRINKALKKMKVNGVVFINSFNFHHPNIAKKIKTALTIYQCVDPMIVPYDMKHGIVNEAMLVKQSDVVICTSKALYDEKKLQNPKTYLVPNAADVEHFKTALDEALPVHKTLHGLPRPIVGYLGTIERRIDYELLCEVIKQNPDKTFVFAGPVWDNQSEPLRAFSNVVIAGAIPYEEAPALVKGFDAAIIPFKKDKVSDTIFPLKLFEYLAAGKPAVLTDFNTDLKEYTGDTVWYCNGVQQFSQAINEALTANTPAKIAARVAIAEQNTWAKRADDVSNIINYYTGAY